MRRILLGAAVLSALGSTSGCGSKNSPAVRSLKGAGATLPAPLYERWFADYNKLHPEVRVSYQGLGSGAGIRQFQQQVVDFAASDAAMNDKEMKEVPADRGVVLIPATAGSIVLSYNLPNGPKELRLSRKAYVGIFQGKIKKWNDPAITAANPNETMPDLPVLPARRSDGSGTTYVFTNHLSAVDSEWKKSPGVGKEVKWAEGLVGQSGNDGVAAYVTQNPGGIGYVEFNFAERSKLPMAVLENKAGRYAAPTPESGQASLATVELPADLRAWIPDPEGKDCYPIVTLTWILAYKKYDDPAKAAALRAVIDYGLTEGQKAAPSLGYLPLPAKIVDAARAALQTVGGGA